MGFSFEYPAVFEQPEYEPICGLRVSNTSVVLADQIVVWSELSEGRTANQLADDMIARNELRIETRSSSDSGDGVSLNFRFGEWNAFGTISLDTYGERLGGIAFYAGALECEIGGQDIGRFQALSRIYRTIEWFDPGP